MGNASKGGADDMGKKKKVVGISVKFVVYGIGRTKEEAIMDAYNEAYEELGIKLKESIISSIDVVAYKEAINIFGDPSILDIDEDN